MVKNIYEKVLGVSLVLSFNNDSNKMPVSYIIMSKEKELFKKYLQDANLYTKDSLMCIINHYRCYIKSKVVNENFLAILSLVVSVALTFLGPNGFDFNSIEKNLPYLIGLGLIVAFIYFSFKEIINIRKIFTGEDGMIERLEAIFSELYVEYDETIHLSSVNRRKRTAKSNNSKTTK